MIRQVDDDIYSALPDVPHKHLYDKRAAAYDSVVSTWLYNRLMWGTSPHDYIAFAREAIGSHPAACILDAGCGSMLFTAQVYIASDRQVIAFDQSLRMLRRARARLRDLAGAVPDRIILLQADLSDLVFRPRRFQTIFCMNVLHQLAGAAELIPKLRVLLAEGGQLYLTSLVSNGRVVGDRWLRTLYKTGEFVSPRSGVELNKLLQDSLDEGVSFRMKGNMAFATVGPTFLSASD
ncbi:MAG TPA: class I SAM-dependent methyltransferase [Pyrinomonadaceae bacterium]|nr:class I SAM-dependent methyltransferase [Pyrinomonadaceae bacterium]